MENKEETQWLLLSWLLYILAMVWNRKQITNKSKFAQDGVAANSWRTKAFYVTKATGDCGVMESIQEKILQLKHDIIYPGENVESKYFVHDI